MNEIVPRSPMPVTFIVTMTIVTTAFFAAFLLTEAQVPSPAGDVKKTGDDYRFAEGPAWNGKDALYFSDMPNNALYCWRASDGVTLIRKGERYSNGIVVDQEGNLLFCEGGCRIMRRSPEGKEDSIADSCDGRPLGMTNDLWMAPRGGIYFTIPVIKPKQADRIPKTVHRGFMSANVS